MDGPVFDAMLKNALEEALRRDVEEAPPPPKLSYRQRRRMSRLLAAPLHTADGWEEPLRRRRNPARWLAAVVVAALLTGVAAAGLALGGGRLFRQKFEDSHWAGNYQNAVNTQQLLDLGAEMDTALVESDGLRFEMLDAVFDGQLAMIAVRMTVLDPEVRAKFEEHAGYFEQVEILTEEGQEVRSHGYSATEIGDGRYDVTFTLNDESLGAGGRCSLRLRDLICLDEENGYQQKTVLFGEWTLTITLRPTEILRLEPNQVCQANGVDWVLEQLTLSPLALRMSFRRKEAGRYSDWGPYKGLAIHLKNGEVRDMKGCSTGIGASDNAMDFRMEFPMPLDMEQLDYLRVCGVDIPLAE